MKESEKSGAENDDEIFILTAASLLKREESPKVGNFAEEIV